MVVPAYNTMTQKARAEGPWIQDHFKLHSEFEVRLAYMATCYLKDGKGRQAGTEREEKGKVYGGGERLEGRVC